MSKAVLKITYEDAELTGKDRKAIASWLREQASLFLKNRAGGHPDTTKYKAIYAYRP